MTIRFSDLSLVDQIEIERWETDVIPPLIVSLTSSIASQTARRDELQVTEDIFIQIYTSFDTVMRLGFLLEAHGLNGSTFTDTPVDPALITAAALNPLSVPLLFPPGSLTTDPVQTAELTAVAASFQTVTPPYTGIPPGSTPTGFNEAQALVDEAAELALALPSLPDVIDYWEAQEAALLNQVAALNTLNLELDVGQPGKTNVVTALSDAMSALSDVQALILGGVLPPATRLSTDIPARQAQITTRFAQITDATIGDQLTYRDERYYWLRRRINLSYGSLTRLEGANRSITSTTQRRDDLVQELAFYVGFRP